jgi:hypothetical protein
MMNKQRLDFIRCVWRGVPVCFRVEQFEELSLRIWAVASLSLHGIFRIA